MKFAYRILLIIMLAASVTILSAQPEGGTSKVGTTAAQFLKIGPGARAIGMGGAYSSIPGDIYNVYYNPAGIANATSNMQVTFNHANWLVDMDYDFAAGSMQLGNLGTMFMTFTSFSVPEDKVRTFDNPEGDGRVWDASSLSLGLGFAKMLTDRFSIGFHFKYIREAIWNSAASGFAIDVGTLYRTPFNDLMIGAAISNFGSTMQMDGRDVQFNYDPNNNEDTGPNNVPSVYEMDSYDIPLTFRIGLSMNVFQNRFFRATASVDAVHPNDNTEYVNSGLELSYDEMFFVRAGYKSLFKQDSEEGLTLGGGVKYKFADNLRVYINYGYADFGRLENVQFFDVGLIF